MEESAAVQKEQNGSWRPKTKFGSWIDRYFSISARGSNIARELLGGLVIFLAMFYILPLNSNMLSGSWATLVKTEDLGRNVQVIDGIRYILLYGDNWATVDQVRAGIFAATAIGAAITTIIMGLYGKLPIGLASGLGLNSLIAYTVMLKMGFNLAQSMAIVLVDGILFLIISVAPLRAWVVRNIPKSLKSAISAGIGFFIAFIGFQNIGIVVPDSSTAVSLGDFKNPSVIAGIAGIVLVIVLSSLPQKSKWAFWVSKFAVIISIVVMAIVCASMGQAGVEGIPTFYDSAYSIKEVGNISKVFGICFYGFDAFANPVAIALAFSLLFVDFFDTAGTLVGVEAGAGMVDENGRIMIDDRPAMVTDAVGTCLGAVCGTTTITSFVESTTGVAAGARTGLAAVTTGLLFALSLAIYPALAIFSSSSVTGLALVYVGVCMFKNLEKLEWKDWVAVGSGFFTVLVMTISYSISDGIAFGFIVYTIMALASGRFKKQDIAVACCSIAFIAIYIVKTLVIKA